MSFYERYKTMCDIRGISPASQATAEKLGCNRSYISHISQNGRTPNGDIVANAAKMLDVSCDYLLEIKDLPGEDEVSREEMTFLIELRKLNPEGRSAALSMMLGLLSSPQFTDQNQDTKKED